MKDKVPDKSLPSSEESERLIIGAIILDNRLMVEAASVLVSEMCFYHPLCRRIYAAMLKLKALGQPIDPILIGEQLKMEGSLESIGGVVVITNMTHGLPMSLNIEPHLKVVKDKWTARQLISKCNAIRDSLWNEEADLSSIIADANASFVRMQDGSQRESFSLAQVTDSVKRTFEAWELGNTHVSSLKTGIPELDGYLRLKGLAKGELTLIGARPSIGKTALLLQISTNVVRMGIPTLFISLEMLKEKLVMRMLPSISGIANKAINPQTFKQQPQEAAKLKEALDNIRELPMYFDRSFQLDQLISTAEFFIQTKGVELVVFDYLTLVKYGIISRRSDTRDAEVGMVTNELKELAVRTDVAVLGAAQMKRESEKEGGKPKMSGFRESGVIEQAVDVALFPFDPLRREHEKAPESVKDALWIELYCDKQRDGARWWSVDLFFDKNMQTLESPMMKGASKSAKFEEAGGMRVYEKKDIMEALDPDGPDF